MPQEDKDDRNETRWFLQQFHADGRTTLLLPFGEGHPNEVTYAPDGTPVFSLGWGENSLTRVKVDPLSEDELPQQGDCIPPLHHPWAREYL